MIYPFKLRACYYADNKDRVYAIRYYSDEFEGPDWYIEL